MPLELEFSPSLDGPLVKEFIKIFGGFFGRDVPSMTLFYSYKDKTYSITDDKETAFFDILSKSIKEKKNLLLEIPPAPKLPKGAMP